MKSRSKREFLAWSLAAVAWPAGIAGAHAGTTGEGGRPALRSPAGELLQFDIGEPGIEHHFYRRGEVAVHLQANQGVKPRLVIAFPAGNTGMGLWFDSAGKPAALGLAKGTRLAGVVRNDGMRGIVAHLSSDATSLDVGTAVLANIRTLRDYVTSGGKVLPKEVESKVTRGAALVFHRTSVEGRHHLELRIVPEHGTRLVTQNGTSRLVAGANGQVHFALTAMVDYAPLTPFAMADLLTADAADRPRDRNALAFLASAENFSAGSWRFLTYFGRDTLLSTGMLMPVLQPAVTEGALGSVLERLSPGGIVAHEDAIGEFAVLENMRSSHPPADVQAPIRDYKMIDGDFILAPVLASYLLDTPQGVARAKAFLARKTTSGHGYGEQLRTNLELVLRRAAPFAADPRAANLVALKDGVPVGNWRDSNNGLGGGRYPFDVNVALVPAALRAAERLYRSGLLGDEPALAARAGQYATAWKDTERFFRMTVPAAEAREQVEAYAKAEGLDAAGAVDAITGPVRYDAIALDAGGNPVPVMHSDSSFVLQFGEPPADYLDTVAAQILAPFPAGLRTAVGVVVANPVYGPEGVRKLFTRSDYHGTVVWSWQQAMLAAGLKRQLERADLPPATLSALRAAQDVLWQGILAMQERSSGELWGWEPKNGKAALAMWASAEGDEACAAQLWSTVYLAVTPPASR
ncbi:MAG: hypothetical protein ACXWC4_14550 [Telluria sp.]